MCLEINNIVLLSKGLFVREHLKFLVHLVHLRMNTNTVIEKVPGNGEISFLLSDLCNFRANKQRCGLRNFDETDLKTVS